MKYKYDFYKDLYYSVKLSVLFIKVSIKCLSGYESCMGGWDYLEYYKLKYYLLIFLLLYF